MPCPSCSRHGNDFHCRVKTVSVASSAMPTRAQQWRSKPRSDKSHDAMDNSNAWERGVVTESAPDGSRVPLLDDSLQPIGLKQWVNEPKWRERKKALDAERTNAGS